MNALNVRILTSISISISVSISIIVIVLVLVLVFVVVVVVAAAVVVVVVVVDPSGLGWSGQASGACRETSHGGPWFPISAAHDNRIHPKLWMQVII